MLKGKITEVFSSIQGEGIYQGISQVFVRFFGCNLNCHFCDTPLNSYKEYSVDDLLARIESLDKGYHFIAFTGGEPLLQDDFLKEIMSRCKAGNKKTYLETNGTLPAALERVIGFTDIIAMDFKLPSSTGGENCWAAHENFLREAVKKEVMVKAVICKSTREQDIIRATHILTQIDRDIPFILQPNFFEQDEELMGKISGYSRYCRQYLSDVRVLMQLHKILAVK